MPIMSQVVKSEQKVDHLSLLAMENNLAELTHEMRGIERNDDYQRKAKLDREGVPNIQEIPAMVLRL